MATLLSSLAAFQSTPPSWEATYKDYNTRREMDISIHASLVGGDARGCTQQQIADISIHASLVGGDEYGR